MEGQTPRGIVVLCSGKVKLSTTSRDGKVLILKMADPGEALGLSAVISGTPYELTAETAQDLVAAGRRFEPAKRLRFLRSAPANSGSGSIPSSDNNTAILFLGVHTSSASRIVATSH